MRNYDIFVEGKVNNVFLSTFLQLFLRIKNAFSTQRSETITLTGICTNSTLSDYMITQFKIVIPAWIAGAEDREANPGSMDGFELAIHGTVYPLPGEYNELVHNLTKRALLKKHWRNSN